MLCGAGIFAGSLLPAGFFSSALTSPALLNILVASHRRLPHAQFKWLLPAEPGKTVKLTLLLAFAATLAAADANWTSVKSLTVGGEIKVSSADGKSFQGQVQSVTDESLVILAANTQQSLPRAQVLKVSTKGESHRKRNTLIGLGIGAGTGLGIGAGVDHGCVPRGCFYSNDIGKAVFTPLGALIGTVIGVAWPTGTWHEVYRAK